MHTIGTVAAIVMAASFAYCAVHLAELSANCFTDGRVKAAIGYRWNAWVCIALAMLFAWLA